MNEERAIMTLQNYCLFTSVTTQRYANREDTRLDTSEYIIIHMYVKLPIREMQSITYHIATTL